MKKLLGLLVCLSLGMTAFAQARVMSTNADIQKGIELHDSAHNGDYSGAQKALELLKPYIKTDAVACAFYGSSLTLLAAECAEKSPVKSLDYLEQGGHYLDEAVKLDPKNGAIRLIRLENGVEVSRSSPVKRYDIIASDVDFLLNGGTNDWNNETKAEAHLYCGMYMLDAGDLDQALDLFDQAVAEAGSTTAGVGAYAQKMLDKYSE